ncbi:MAG: DUF4118 domain-containing protein [Caulobacterales bacterium]|nr:DUF4118 domain-containing protein [Caulobacterales bacterium]
MTSHGAAWLSHLPGYAGALLLVALAYAVAAAARLSLGAGNIAMLFLLTVLVAAVALGLGPALLAALAAALTYNFFFLDPRFTFWIEHPADILTFSVFFAVAVATGWLAGQVRDQARLAQRKADIITSLLESSRALSATASVEEASQALADQVARVTQGPAIVLLPDEAGSMRLMGAPAGLESLDPGTVRAARAAWDAKPLAGGDPAETGSWAKPPAGWAFRSLDGMRGRVGVLGMRNNQTGAGPDGESLLGAQIRQGAVALERAQFALAAAENHALRKADDLRAALLNSISHDFRTPLSTVLGSATTLLEYGADLKPAVRRDLLKSIEDEARRINRYVGDLLDMSRLEGGALQPRQDWVDVRAVIAAAVDRLGDRLGRRRIVRDFAKPLSRLKLDPILLEQAMFNLLQNAVSYAPEGSAIEVSVYEDRDHLAITVEDRGPGVPAAELSSIFDKFKRLERPSDRGAGLGLGLAITKGFVEAMGGRIAAASPVCPEGGTRFVVSFPKPVSTPGDFL